MKDIVEVFDVTQMVFVALHKVLIFAILKTKSH